MMKLVKGILISMLISGLMFTGFIGCSSNDEEESQLPTLPPDSSMSMDFSAFGGGKMAPSAPIIGKNFINAATRDLFIDAAVIITLSPSVTVFKAAKSVAPAIQSDGSWVWTYPVAYLGHEYEAKLTGRIEGVNVLWSMKITCPTIQPPLDDFEWYTGECAIDNTSGTWRFFDYKFPNDAKEIGIIDWSVTALDKGKLEFASTNTSVAIVGDVLTYSIDGKDMEYNYTCWKYQSSRL
jgi:hypothetical protein